LKYPVNSNFMEKTQRRSEENLKQNQVSLRQIKARLKEEIESKYNMTVVEFCKSGIPEEQFGLKGSNLQNYLAAGSVSLEAYNTLYKYFGLGTLVRKYKVQKVAEFFVVPELKKKKSKKVEKE
jgi:hypothetical protein